MNAFAKPNLAVDQIPSASAADKDKVLTIDSNGVPVWAENQGGGTGGGVLVVTADENGVLDKTWKEIYDAPFALVKQMTPDGYADIGFRTGAELFEGEYDLYFCDMSDVELGLRVLMYVADSADGYPTLDTAQ